MRTESESTEATLRRRRTLFAGFVARMEDTRLPRCVMFGQLVGSAGCVGDARKRVDGVFPGRPQIFGISAEQWTTAAQDEEKNGAGRRNKGRNFHGETYRCRESQGWTAACSSMPERHGKDQEGGDSQKQARAGSLAIVVTFGRLVCRCYAVFPWCYVCFQQFRFRLIRVFRV